jgi:hypothetical protein
LVQACRSRYASDCLMSRVCRRNTTRLVVQYSTYKTLDLIALSCEGERWERWRWNRLRSSGGSCERLVRDSIPPLHPCALPSPLLRHSFATVPILPIMPQTHPWQQARLLRLAEVDRWCFRCGWMDRRPFCGTLGLTSVLAARYGPELWGRMIPAASPFAPVTARSWLILLIDARPSHPPNHPRPSRRTLRQRMPLRCHSR